MMALHKDRENTFSRDLKDFSWGPTCLALSSSTPLTSEIFPLGQQSTLCAQFVMPNIQTRHTHGQRHGHRGVGPMGLQSFLKGESTEDWVDTAICAGLRVFYYYLHIIQYLYHESTEDWGDTAACPGLRLLYYNLYILYYYYYYCVRRNGGYRCMCMFACILLLFVYFMLLLLLLLLCILLLY